MHSIGDVGGRARSWCQQRPCEFAAWLMVDAASSTAVSLLQLLVGDVVNVCNLLWICGAMVQHSTCTNAACQQVLVLAATTNLHIVMCMMRHDALAESNVNSDVNGGQHSQPALGLLWQGSTRRLQSELTDVFVTWRISSARSSICCAVRQRRL